MRRSYVLPLLSSCVCLLFLAEAAAHPPAGSKTVHYPRVYGATGHTYGPTQAHYQYQRQYGRPWHGYGGETVTLPTGSLTQHHHSSGYTYRPYSYYPFAYSGYSPYVGYYSGVSVGPPGYADYGPVHSYIPMAPIVIQAHPQFIGQNPFDNSVLKDALLENELRWGKDLIVEPQVQTVEREIRESTPAAKLKSLRAQAQGDEWFRKENYLQAYSRYKVAVAEADDRADAHFRLGYALLAMGRYDRAVKEMKRGLRIDPAWPVTGESLSTIFGPENLLAKSTTMSEVTAWVREDIRDPDRLFLIGVLLHFDDDERAAEFFETAIRLSGGGAHLLAFLKKPDNPAAEPPKNTSAKDGSPPKNDALPQNGAPAEPQSDDPLLPPLPKSP